MANLIGYSERHAKIVEVEYLGANGSMTSLMKLFAVGYAASEFPDARYARNHVSVLPGTWQANKGEMQYVFKTVESVQRVIALHGQDCFWADFHLQTPAANFFRKKPHCPIYEGVLIPLLLDEITSSDIHIQDGTALKKVSEAWTAVLPFLNKSPAIERLTLMVEMATKACKNYGILHIS